MKRRSTALQELGERLLALRPAVRATLDLPPELEEALAFHDTLTKHEARRRQRQYVGRLMRELEPEAAEAAEAALARLAGR